MQDSLPLKDLPRRPESLWHSLSLPIADEFCSSHWSPLLTPQTATDFDVQHNPIDSDDSSARSTLRPYSYTDADNTSTHTLLRPKSYFSYESVHDSANEELHNEPDFATEDGAHDLQNDQEGSYGVSTLKQPKETGALRRPAENELWVSRQSASSQSRLAVDDGGWWWHQMLVDRSLRSMAALTTIFALMMVILCIVYFGNFVHRVNANSTSVGEISGESCSTMESSNIVYLPNPFIPIRSSPCWLQCPY